MNLTYLEKTFIRKNIRNIRTQEHITNDDKLMLLYLKSLIINEYNHEFYNDDVLQPILGECEVCNIKNVRNLTTHNEGKKHKNKLLKSKI